MLIKSVYAVANTFLLLAGPRRCVPNDCRIQLSASSMRIRTRRLPIFKCGRPRAIRLSTWRGENCHRCAYPRLSVMFVAAAGVPSIASPLLLNFSSLFIMLLIYDCGGHDAKKQWAVVTE